jgi:uncharacterized protein
MHGVFPRWCARLYAGIVFGASFLCISAGGTATAQPKGPVRSLIEMRTEGVILQKTDLSCGAAAVATLLNFQFGDRVTEREVTEGLIRRKEYIEHPEIVRVREGFSLLDMKRYVATRGYVGIGYGKLEFRDLLRLAPIIVAVRPLGYNHFVVFKGVANDKVLVADPAFGNETMRRDVFEDIWINFPQIGRVGFIVTRKGEPAPPGDLLPRPRQYLAPPADFVRQILG